MKQTRSLSEFKCLFEYTRLNLMFSPSYHIHFHRTHPGTVSLRHTGTLLVSNDKHHTRSLELCSLSYKKQRMLKVCNHLKMSCVTDHIHMYVFTKTSSPMGNDRSAWSQHNVWRHHNLRCSKADNSELETVTRN